MLVGSLIYLVFLAMSLPLSLMLAIKFKDSPYGVIMKYLLLFIVSLIVSSVLGLFDLVLESAIAEQVSMIFIILLSVKFLRVFVRGRQKMIHEYLHIFHAVLSAVSAVIIIYVLSSKKTVGLAFGKSFREFAVVLLLFGVIGVMEFIGLESATGVLDAVFSVGLFYIIWRHVKSVYHF